MKQELRIAAAILAAALGAPASAHEPSVDPARSEVVEPAPAIVPPDAGAAGVTGPRGQGRDERAETHPDFTLRLSVFGAGAEPRSPDFARWLGFEWRAMGLGRDAQGPSPGLRLCPPLEPGGHAVLLVEESVSEQPGGLFVRWRWLALGAPAAGDTARNPHEGRSPGGALR